MDADVTGDLRHEVEEHAGRFQVIVEVQLVGDHHGVQAEALDAPVPRNAVALEELVPGEPVLGLLGLADDEVPLAKRSRGCSGRTGDPGNPAVFWRKSMCVMSSRLMMAPSCRAFTYSADGVSLDVNMICSPVMPTFSDMTSSAIELQSAPNPSSFMMARMCGFGHAFTAKCSRNPSAQAKRLLQRAGVLPDGLLIIDVKRRGMGRDDLLQLAPREREPLVGHALLRIAQV